MPVGRIWVAKVLCYLIFRGGTSEAPGCPWTYAGSNRVRLIRPTIPIFLVSWLVVSQIGSPGAAYIPPDATADLSVSFAEARNGDPADLAFPFVRRQWGQRGRGDWYVLPPDDSLGKYEFYFTRAIYSGFRRGWSWSIDFPRADRIFLEGLRRMTVIDAYDMENPVRLDDPKLFKFPFIYALEVGAMGLTDSEARALRTYLFAGGFLFIDDFWGSYEWMNFEREISRVLPGYPIQELSLDHPAFTTVYDIDSIVQVPNVGNGTRGGPTWERDGYVPHVRGIFDDNGRLMVAIHWNTDLGDAWEWADNPYYPLRYSNYAWQVAINFIVYAMTH